MGDVPKPPVPDIVIEVLGGDWPDGSETAMYALADVWDRAADDLEEVRGDAAAALTDLLSNIEAESKEPMRTSMNKLIEDDAGLKAQIADCRALAELCRGFAGDLETTKWIINVAMIEAVASLAFAFFGPIGFAAAAAKMAAKKAMIKAAIKGAISKIASKGATTTISAAVKKAPSVMAREIATQSAGEAAVNATGQAIAASDGSTDFSGSDVVDAARNGGMYGVGSGLTRKFAGGRGGRAGRFATEAGAGVAGTTTSALGNGGVPDAKDLGIGAAEGLIGGNHHGAGSTNGGASATADPGAGPNAHAGTPSVAEPGVAAGPGPATPGGDPAGPGPGPGESVTPGGDPGGPGPVTGESVTPGGDPGGPGPVAGESVSPTGDGAANHAASMDSGAGQGGGQHDAGANIAPADADTAPTGGDGAGQTGGDGAGQTGGDGGGQGGSDGAGASSGGDSGTAGDGPASGGESSGSGSDSSATGSDGSAAGGDPSTAGSDSSPSGTGSEASGAEASTAGAPPVGTDHLSGLDLGGTVGDSTSATSSNLTDAAGLSGDSGTSTDAGSATAGNPGGDPTSVSPGGTGPVGDSSSGSTPGGDHAGTDQGGVAAAPPVGAGAAGGASGGGSTTSGHSSSSPTRGAETTSTPRADGQSTTGHSGSAPDADPTPDGQSVAPEDSSSTAGEADSPIDVVADGAPTDVSAGSNSSAPAGTRGTGPDGLPSVDQHDTTVAPERTDISSTADDSTTIAEEGATPDSDHLSGLDLPGAGAGVPSVVTTSSPTATSGAMSGGASPGSSSPTRGTEGTGLDHSDGQTMREDGEATTAADSRPATPTGPADVDTTYCAQNSLDALGARHEGLNPSTLPDRGLDPVPAGDVFRAAGITPDLHRNSEGSTPTDPDCTHPAYDAIGDRLATLGDGSSALITSNWTAGTHTGGHAYVAHNDGGQIMFEDPTSGERHAWPPTYSEVGNVAAGYVAPDGTPVHGDSTPAEVSTTVGDVDANKKPATYTDWETSDLGDFHSDFSADTHAHPEGGGEQTVHTRTATLPTGETITIEERVTAYESGQPPGQDPPPLDGERVTVTTTSVSSMSDPDARNTVTWTEHGARTVNAEISLRHSFEGMGRTSEETGHQSAVSGGDGHGAVIGDHAGHIAAHRFMLDQGLPNLFAQNGNFNTSAYKKMENEWAALVNDGLEVEATIAFGYESGSTRPARVEVDFVGIDPGQDGKVVFQPPEDSDFTNAAHQVYERAY